MPKPTNYKDRLRPWIPPTVMHWYRQRVWNARKLKETEGQAVDFTLPVCGLNELFPGLETISAQLAVSLLAPQGSWALPLPEMLALAGVCQQIKPLRVFEFGTYTGVSTLVMAMNTPDNAEIFTLDLDPDRRETHHHGSGVGGFPDFVVGQQFQKTAVAHKIHQRFGDSKTFDFSPFFNSMDLVLVDADHTYQFVKHDTQVAFQLLKAGGVILWDDYRWQENTPECAGVTRCVNEIAIKVPCFQIAGTRLAIYPGDRSHSPNLP